MNNPRSSIFFHLTKHIDNLKGILKLKCFQSKYCSENADWYELNFRVAYPMVCFCDIPISRIGAHTKYYGEFGIGLSKQWGLKNKLNPIAYCPEDGLLINVAKSLDGKIDWQKKEESKQQELISQFFSLTKLMKPLKGNIKDNSGEIDFYQECEWRYTPEKLINSYVIVDGTPASKSEIDKRNSEAENEAHVLKFVPEDVKYIFVPKEDCIPNIAKCIFEYFNEYDKDELHILISKIISLETIQSDL